MLLLLSYSEPKRNEKIKHILYVSKCVCVCVWVVYYMEFLYSFILHFFSGYKIAISIVRENESERKIVWDAQNSVHLKFFSFFFLFRPNNTIPLRWEEFFFFVSVLFWYCLHTFTLNTFYGTTKQQKNG